MSMLMTVISTMSMLNVTGAIEAEFTRVGERTQLSRRFHRYPLKIAKAFPFDHGQLGVYMMDASPGMMAGDSYDVQIRLEEGTNVLLTNQSYTKVHPAGSAADTPGTPFSRPSVLRQTIRLAPGSLLEYMPEPLMLYKDAILHADTQVHLAAGSTMLMSEIVCPGRTHRGELFQFERWRSSLEVHYDGELVYCSRLQLEPSGTSPHSMTGFDRFTHLGTLYAFAGTLNPQHVERLRETLSAVQADSPVEYGVSLGCKHSLVVSVLACTVHGVERLLGTAWSELRAMLLGLPPASVPK